MKKKLLTLVMAFAMCLSLLPMEAGAARFVGASKDGEIVYRADEDGAMSPIKDSEVPLAPSNLPAHVLAYYANCSKKESCPLDKYIDTTNDLWWHDGIHYCLEKGIMNGMGEGQFIPAGATTRGMIVTILYRLAGSPTFMNTNVFSDVKAGQWYEKAVVWANGKGIVNGYGDNTFGPDNVITREQLAVILYRYAQSIGVDAFTVMRNTSLQSFTDGSAVSVWARGGVNFCIAAGILTGDNGRIRPQFNAIRAEIATMLQRFCENML